MFPLTTNVIFAFLYVCCSAAQSSTGSNQTQADSSHIIVVPELNLAVTYPDDGMYGHYRVERRSVAGQMAAFEIQAHYGNLILSSISFTNFDSVNAFAERFLKSGESWDVDADEALETGEDFLLREQKFKSKTAGYYTDFVEVQGRQFANKRGHSEPCGCFYNRSFTFVGDARIQINITTYADTLRKKIEKQLIDSLGLVYWHGSFYLRSELPDTSQKTGEARMMMKKEAPSRKRFNFIEALLEAVSDRLQEDYIDLLKRIRIEKLK